MKQNYVTMTKRIDDNTIKHITLTLFGCGVEITPEINPMYGSNDFKDRQGL